MANVVLPNNAFDLRPGSAPRGRINRFGKQVSAAAKTLSPHVTSQEEQASIVSNDDEYTSSSGSSSGDTSGSAFSSSVRNTIGKPDMATSGWERTRGLLTQKRRMQKTLKKALAGAAKESQRLEQMEREVSIYEHKDDTSSTIRTDTSTTQSNSGYKKSHSSSFNDNDDDSAVHLLIESRCDKGLARTQSAMPSIISAARTENVTDSVSSRSVVYQDVKELSMRCAKMEIELESKDGKMKQINEEKQSIVRKYTEAREHHRSMRRKYEAMYTKMCIKQGEELATMNADKAEMRKQIKERDLIIKQLLAANEKLEAALKEMTKVAEDALKAKKQVREDLKKLRTGHLNDIMTPRMSEGRALFRGLTPW